MPDVDLWLLAHLGREGPDWLRAYLLTLALEVPLAALLLGRWLPSWPRRLGLCTLANTLTHPTLWFVLPRFSPMALWLVLAEGWVFATEAAIFAWAVRDHGAKARRGAALTAVVANGASWLFGALLLW
ncbi:MAG: hypothetical protein H6747_14545 [Deltaproteobacteria bacterium]|nr:hypothetical protein [Deltaproteobacteria bacterium]